MPETFNPTVVLAYNRARARAASARAEKALARLGAPARETAMRREALTPAQRAAAIKAKEGPLGWVFEGASLEDVIADSRFLKKVVNIYKARPRMRGGHSTTLHLRNGRTVKLNTSTGELIRP
jgi:hypothetical protein